MGRTFQTLITFRLLHAGFYYIELLTPLSYVISLMFRSLLGFKRVFPVFSSLCTLYLREERGIISYCNNFNTSYARVQNTRAHAHGWCDSVGCQRLYCEKAWLPSLPAPASALTRCVDVSFL